MPAPRTPVVPALLGGAGVIPFAVSALLFAFGDPRLAGPALLALVTYSAAILSFLGGARWGAEMQARERPNGVTLALSNVPALVGWALLAAPFAEPVLQLSGFLAAFVVQWAWDRTAGGLPAWYRRLRTPLTLGAGLSLALALWRAVGI